MSNYVSIIGLTGDRLVQKRFRLRKRLKREHQKNLSLAPSQSEPEPTTWTIDDIAYKKYYEYLFYGG